MLKLQLDDVVAREVEQSLVRVLVLSLHGE